MKIRIINEPEFTKVLEDKSDFRYTLCIDVELYDYGDRRIDRKPDSFPEKPFTYLTCLELDALNEEYVQTMKPHSSTPEEREQRYQDLLQQINDQLIGRWLVVKE